MTTCQISIILIAIAVLLAVVFLLGRENFSDKPFLTAGALNCNVFPDAPECKKIKCSSNADCAGQKLCDESGNCIPIPICDQGVCTTPTNKDLTTCAPSDGVWSTPDSDNLGRSKLRSPCCQPSDYKLPKNYKTCNDDLNINDPTEACIDRCCDYVDDQRLNYDVSWYPMAKCACSLWCYNQDVAHFNKWGTAQHYVTGDIAEARTKDTGDYIGGGRDGISGGVIREEDI